MGTTVRNVITYQGMAKCHSRAWLDVGPRKAMWQVAQLSAFGQLKVAHAVLAISNVLAI
jgi:hypothetical protein